MTSLHEMHCAEPECGAQFFSYRSDARYCSPACRQHAYRQRASTRPRPIGELIADLARIGDELEGHGLGDDEERDGPRRRGLEALEFSDESIFAIRAIRNHLIARLDAIEECLTNESMQRHTWAAIAAMARDDQEAKERHLAAWRYPDQNNRHQV